MNQQLYTIVEVSDLLKITRSHAYRLKKSQTWPHIMLGGSLRFTSGDIDAIQAMNRKQPPPDKSPGRRPPRIPKRP
ncbi:helix-turn-helix domain-containing protein [Paenarthrobacter sp. NPDC089322]|uniref:helix-turn-helix domain-containing protein n=1 Tax=Paenarthrobacter sp. NPDC089322 TaxID=3155065 RepID=UPI003414C280